MTPAQAYLSIAIDLIGQEDLVDLLQRYGYHTDVATVDQLSQALTLEGVDFAKEFSDLAKEAAKRPTAKARFDEQANLLKATGSDESGSATTLTEEEKAAASERGLSWFSAVTSSLGELAGAAGGIISAINSKYAFANTESLLEQERRREEEKTKQYLIIGGIGFIIVLVICFMLYSMFRKH